VATPEVRREGRRETGATAGLHTLRKGDGQLERLVGVVQVLDRDLERRLGQLFPEANDRDDLDQPQPRSTGIVRADADLGNDEGVGDGCDRRGRRLREQGDERCGDKTKEAEHRISEGSS